jgi:hypothetical protein
MGLIGSAAFHCSVMANPPRQLSKCLSHIVSRNVNNTIVKSHASLRITIACFVQPAVGLMTPRYSSKRKLSLLARLQPNSIGFNNNSKSKTN